MGRYCFDASFILTWLIPERRTPPLQQRWLAFSSQDEILAPHLLLAECTSVLREYVYRGRLSQSSAQQLIKALCQMPIMFIHRPDIFTRGLQIAAELGWQKAYDALYIAIAELEHGELLTLDRGMYQAALRLSLPATLIE